MSFVITYCQLNSIVYVHNFLNLRNRNQDAVREMSDSFRQGLNIEAASFGTVTIVIPEQWNQSSACKDLISDGLPNLSWVRNYKADINIVPDHPVFGAQPYSFQYGRCGQPSLPISLPLTALADPDARGISS